MKKEEAVRIYRLALEECWSLLDKATDLYGKAWDKEFLKKVRKASQKADMKRMHAWEADEDEPWTLKTRTCPNCPYRE